MLNSNPRLRHVKTNTYNGHAEVKNHILNHRWRIFKLLTIQLPFSKPLPKFAQTNCFLASVCLCLLFPCHPYPVPCSDLANFLFRVLPKNWKSPAWPRCDLFGRAAPPTVFRDPLSRVGTKKGEREWPLREGCGRSKPKQARKKNSCISRMQATMSGP